VLQLCFNPVASLLHELPLLQDAMYREPAENVTAYRTVLELVRRGSRGGVDVALELLADRDAATVRVVARAPAATAPKKKKKKDKRRGARPAPTARFASSTRSSH
jgi:hypothetical protein